MQRRAAQTPEDKLRVIISPPATTSAALNPAKTSLPPSNSVSRGACSYQGVFLILAISAVQLPESRATASPRHVLKREIRFSAKREHPRAYCVAQAHGRTEVASTCSHRFRNVHT
jgi:hypothetical protein